MLNRGDVVGGLYQVLEPIGSGGTSLVYKGVHLHLGTEIVLKRVRDEQRAKIRDVKEEAEILTRLKHAYLPRIYDFLETPDGVFTIIDFIPGKSLGWYIRQGYRIKQSQLVEWMIELCEALQYLHACDPPIIHCDVKPDNIMITPKGKVCLIDFNISIGGSPDSRLGGTSAGYASPEQVRAALSRGREELRLDGRSDIYSLGASFYHMITGIRPADLSRGEKPVPFSSFQTGYSEAFLDTVEKMMRADPADRFQTAEEAGEALRQLYRRDKRYASFQRTKGLLTVLFAALMAGSVLVAALGVRQLGRDGDSAYTSLVLAGNASREAGDYDAALSQYDSAISMDAARISAYYEKMMLYADQGNYQACVFFGQQVLTSEVLAEAMEENPREAADFYYLMGTGYFEQEKYVDAVNCYREALARNEGNPEYYRDYAISLARMMQTEEAEEALDQAVEAGMDDQSVQMVEAELKLADGNWQQAAEQFRSICYAAPEVSTRRRAYLFWARACGMGGDLEQEAQVLEEALGLLPGDAALVSDLGETCLQICAQDETRTDAAQRARECWQLLEDKGNTSAEVRLNLASACRLLGDYDAAEAELTALSEEDPSDYRSYRDLAFLVIQREGDKPNEERDYSRIPELYNQAVEAYQTAAANGVSDPQMQTLENAVQQLIQGGWFGQIPAEGAQ